MSSRAHWGPLLFLALTFVTLTFAALIRGVTAWCKCCNEMAHDGE
jgi:hypothetical protein